MKDRTLDTVGRAKEAAQRGPEAKDVAQRAREAAKEKVMDLFSLLHTTILML